MDPVICSCGKEIEIKDRKGKCVCGMQVLIVPDADTLLQENPEILSKMRELYDPPPDKPIIVE